MNWKKLLIYGVIGYGAYYLLKKKGILAGVGQLPLRYRSRAQYWPQRTIYKPEVPELN